MKDNEKTKEQLVKELVEMRQRISKLEASGTRRIRVEDELKGTFLEKVIDTTRDGIMITDEKGQIIFVNTALAKLAGCRKEEMIGEHTSVLAPKDEEYREMVSGKISELIELGSTRYETYFKRPDGECIDVEWNISMIKDKSGNYMAAVSIVHDITNHKRIEGELKGTKEFLENLIETAADGIMINDLMGNITNVNSALEKMTGLKKEDLIGEHSSILIKEDEEIRKRFREKAAELFEKGYASYETALRRKDGKHVEVEYSTTLVKDEKGDFIAGISIFRDVTERKKAEKDIFESKEFLENIFKTSADAIMVTDPQGNITMVNDTMVKIAGYSRDELLGKHSSILAPPDKELRARIVGDIKKLFEEGSLYESEAVWQRKDGQHISTESNITLLRDKDEQVIGSVSFIRDITEKKKVESMLLQSEKLKSLGELAGGVAHDFNNVLAAILGRVQLLSMSLETPSGKQERRKVMRELRKGLKIIEKASLDGAETVRRIQEFSRRRTDDKYFTQVDINELIDNALDFTKTRWKDETESKGIKIKIKKELSPLPSIAGSASELREVFTNFINNALDAMPQGGEIKIRTCKEDNYISIRVEDTGRGISEAIRDRIFDPFYTTKGPQSTGLGMSVSYGIITRHKGTISVDSQEGKGTTFTIKIPIKEVEVVKEKKVQGLPRKGRKGNILIVEDEEDIRILLSEILTSDGHLVSVASDGKKGVEIFRKGSFDLVMTDLGMPGMSGWEVASSVKKLAPEVIVVIITGWDIRLGRDELKQKGVDMVVNKPFKVKQVLKLVQEAIEIKSKVKRGKA